MSSKKPIEISPAQYKEYVKLKKAHDKHLLVIKEHNKKNVSKTFHCDVCDRDYKLLSKSNHLKSKIHNKKASEGSSDEEEYKLPDPEGLDYGLESPTKKAPEAVANDNTRVYTCLKCSVVNLCQCNQPIEQLYKIHKKYICLSCTKCEKC